MVVPLREKKAFDLQSPGIWNLVVDEVEIVRPLIAKTVAQKVPAAESTIYFVVAPVEMIHAAVVKLFATNDVAGVYVPSAVVYAKGVAKVASLALQMIATAD